MRIASIGKGLHALLRKRRAESELDEELEAFVEAAVAENLRCGMSVEQARSSALAETGSRNLVKHLVWSSRWESHVETLLGDLQIRR